MSARHDIFTALRRLRPQEFSAETIEAQARELARAMQDSLPPLECSDLCENFIARVTAEKVGATVERLAGWQDLPEAVARYARDARTGKGSGAATGPAPAKSRLGGFFARGCALKTDSMLAVGAARGGIAETGSLVFHSGPEAPTLYGFLPLHHVVALEARTIVARFEDYAAAEQGQPQPRNVNFITGASGTTDIEGVLARGAHGPRRLHILILG